MPPPAERPTRTLTPVQVEAAKALVDALQHDDASVFARLKPLSLDELIAIQDSCRFVRAVAAGVAGHWLSDRE